MNVRNLIVIMAVITVLAYWVFRPRPYGAGDSVSDFTLRAIDGEAVSLSDFKGQTVFIEFFTTWCPVCQTAFPQTSKLKSRLSEASDMAFIAINRGESLSVVKRFVERYDKNWPVLLDPDQEVYKQFFTESVPAFVIIDAAGRLAYKVTGWWSSNQAALDILFGELKKARGDRAADAACAIAELQSDQNKGKRRP